MLDLLLRRVAHAGPVAHEHHPGGHVRGEDARVVAGEADELRQVADRVEHAAVERHAVAVRRGRQLDLDAGRGVKLGGAGGERIPPRDELLGVRRAAVDPQPHARRHGRERVRLDQDARGGDEEVLVVAGELVGGDDQARRGGQRVAPLAAPRRAGVVGAAGERERQPHARRERPHGAGRCPEPREIAGLVDVQLDEHAQAKLPGRRVAERVGIGARRAHRVAQRDAVVVRPVEHVGDVEPPDQRARPERRRVEPRALLVGERDDRDAGQALGRRRSPRRRRARRRSARRCARCRGASRSRPGSVRRPAPPTASRPGRARPAARRRAPARGTSPRRRRARASMRAASSRPARARSARGPRAGRAAPPPRSVATSQSRGAPAPRVGDRDVRRLRHDTRHAWSGRTQRPRRPRSRSRPGCGRSGTGRARPDRRARARRRACRARASRAPPTSPARRRR